MPALLGLLSTFYFRIHCGGASAGTGRRLLTALTQVRFLSPQLRIDERKGKPTGDGNCLENSRAMSLEGSTPSPSAMGQGPTEWRASKGERRKETILPVLLGLLSTFYSLLSAQHRALDQSAKAPASQAGKAGSTPAGHSRGSANGRLPAFEAGDEGSTPSPRILANSF